jgi:hypothetical protein
MTDRSSIFASLDRFIEQFASDIDRKSGHQSATGNDPVSNHNPLEEKGVGHSGHCGHLKRETCFESDRDARKACLPSNDGSRTPFARGALFTGVKTVQTVQSALYQRLAVGHLEDAGVHSVKSPCTRGLPRDQTTTTDCRDHQVPSPAARSRSDPGWWRDFFEERAAHREFDGQRSRAEAERLAWDDCILEWHRRYAGRASRDLCAGCRRPIGTSEALTLWDGNRVHDQSGQECLRTYGQRWRGTAARALVALGLPSAASGQNYADNQ